MLFKFLLLLTIICYCKAGGEAQKKGQESNSADWDPSGKKVTVAYYYGSFDPLGAKVYLNNILVAFLVLCHDVKFDLVPFGKSYFDGKQYICQYGPKECLANTMEACLLHICDYSKCLKQAFGAIGCLDGDVQEGKISPKLLLYKFQKCMISFVGVDVEAKVEKCAQGERGRELTKWMEKQTKKAAPKTFPCDKFQKVFIEISQKHTRIHEQQNQYKKPSYIPLKNFNGFLSRRGLMQTIRRDRSHRSLIGGFSEHRQVTTPDTLDYG